ncbi:MAG: RIP metalloprotease RseP [Eubacteriales bacterium]|nr:RIP metalloprotease RseP [Eubacteriales bacterium]
MLVSIIAFLVIFSVIVISHEFGHYAIARRNGIRVTEFDIGMGPTLFHWQRGETEFCIKALPIGGACLFDGMNGLEQEKGDLDEHAFPNAPVWGRIATVFAGPFANFILGFLFAVIIVAFAGTDLPVVQQIMPDSAAQEAGLQAGDTITRINGESIHLYREVSLISAMNYGEPLTITYERSGEKSTVTVTPKYDEASGRYYIGLLGSGEYLKCNALQVFQYGFYEAEYWVKATVKSLGTIFTGHFSKDDLSGPVGVVKIVDDTYDQAKQYGIETVLLSFLNIATLLSINLGIVNLLPLPALDGGRLVFLLIEAIRGKPIPPDKEGMVHLAGIIALFALMIFVLFNDISKYFR